jgi:hypothetical protein
MAIIIIMIAQGVIASLGGVILGLFLVVARIMQARRSRCHQDRGLGLIRSGREA